VIATDASPRSIRQKVPVLDKRVLALRRNHGRPRIQTNPHAAVAIGRCVSRAADLETPVVTFTVKLAALARLRVRDEGLTLHVAFGGTCVQLNATAPLELVPDTMESEYAAVWPEVTVAVLIFELPAPKEKLGAVPVPERATV
jgi:hypothetical protein